jgi:hypothetical protein
MKREQAELLIERSKIAYVLDPERSNLLNALVEWRDAIAARSSGDLKSTPYMTEEKFVDVLGKRVDADKRIEQARNNLTTAITILFSGIETPEQMVAVSFGVEEVVAAVKGFKRRKSPVQVIIPEE